MESSAASMSSPTARVQKAQAVIPHQKFEGHTDWVTGVIHLRGGQRIMTCSHDGSLRVWNVERGKQIGEDWRDDGAGMNTAALSPDGKTVLSGSPDGVVRLWDIDIAKVIARWMGHTAAVTSLCWSRNGRRVVSGAWDRTLRVWDAETGESTILELLEFDRVWAAIYSPDETMIAAGGGGNDPGDTRVGFIKIWNANTGKLVKNIGPMAGEVYCLAWPGDGKTLISGSFDYEIRIWNTTTWQQIAVLTGHTSTVHHIAVSPNGRILASASWDHTARLWNLDNGQPISSPLQHAHNMRCVSFSADGKVLATGCWNNNAYTWDVSAIVREAGLEELLSNPHDVDHSLLDAHATRRPVQRLRHAHRPPPGFFDNSPDIHAYSGRRRPPLSSAGQPQVASNLASRGRTLLSSLFRRIDHTSPPGLILNQSGGLSSDTALRRNHGGIGLQQRSPSVTDVPFAQGQRRNVSAREVRLRKEKEKNAKKTSAGTSRPPHSSVTQQSGAASQTQPSPQSNATVSSSSTTHADSATSAVAIPTTSPPDVTIRQAGRWARFCLHFFLFISCTSAEYTDGH